MKASEIMIEKLRSFVMFPERASVSVVCALARAELDRRTTPKVKEPEVRYYRDCWHDQVLYKVVDGVITESDALSMVGEKFRCESCRKKEITAAEYEKAKNVAAKPEPVEPWIVVDGYPLAVNDIVDAFKQLQRKHDALEASVKALREKMEGGK